MVWCPEEDLTFHLFHWQRLAKAVLLAQAVQPPARWPDHGRLLTVPSGVLPASTPPQAQQQVEGPVACRVRQREDTGQGTWVNMLRCPCRSLSAQPASLSCVMASWDSQWPARLIAHSSPGENFHPGPGHTRGHFPGKKQLYQPLRWMCLPHVFCAHSHRLGENSGLEGPTETLASASQRH